MLGEKVMIRITLTGIFLFLLSLCGANPLHAQTQGASTQATYQVPVQPGQVVDVIRTVKPKLEEINFCNYTLGFLVSRYHQGQLQIVGLGNVDGKAWFRVSFGGAQVITSIENNF